MLLLKPFNLGRSMLLRKLRTFHFHYAYEFLHSHTRICVRLLGPCFKTGRLKPFGQNHNSPSYSLELVRHSLFWTRKYHFVRGFWSVLWDFWPRCTVMTSISFNRFLLNDFRSFHSLFKVLFIFPSQYLYSIGLPSIFSFGRIISPT